MVQLAIAGHAGFAVTDLELRRPGPSYTVDTLLVVGESASGCVRATVVEARSLRFRVIVVEDCVYDRHEATRAMNLFDMDQKYADVLPSAQVISWIEQRQAGAAVAP